MLAYLDWETQAFGLLAVRSGVVTRTGVAEHVEGPPGGIELAAEQNRTVTGHHGRAVLVDELELPLVRHGCVIVVTSADTGLMAPSTGVI